MSDHEYDKIALNLLKSLALALAPKLLTLALERITSKSQCSRCSRKDTHKE